MDRGAGNPRPCCAARGAGTRLAAGSGRTLGGLCAAVAAAAARKTRRQNAFDDNIAAARWLVAAGYTTPSRLASRGNSNGGLLVAVSAMQAPEAFGAVFCRAPTRDMLRFPQFGHLSAATVEYGSPDDPVEGAYLAGYSPYHNVRADRRYPVMLSSCRP